ncbi:MAG: UPF0280 family protein [Candidatus Omnitrophota bacterium]
MFEDRFYRDSVNAKGLIKFRVNIDETDILIFTETDFSELAYRFVRRLRYEIRKYIQLNFSFFKSLKPVNVDCNAPKIIQDMQRASLKAGVGPMAAVAGVIADYLGGALSKKSKEVIVENGGDIYFASQKERLVKIYAGNSVLSGKIALNIKPEKSPLGICTSSKTIGHSMSFGIADAACVVAKSACTADAFATSIGNSIKSEENLQGILEKFNFTEDVFGAVVIVKEKLACIGDIELVML